MRRTEQYTSRYIFVGAAGHGSEKEGMTALKERLPVTLSYRYFVVTTSVTKYIFIYIYI